MPSLIGIKVEYTNFNLPYWSIFSRECYNNPDDCCSEDSPATGTGTGVGLPITVVSACTCTALPTTLYVTIVSTCSDINGTYPIVYDYLDEKWKYLGPSNLDGSLLYLELYFELYNPFPGHCYAVFSSGYSVAGITKHSPPSGYAYPSNDPLFATFTPQFDCEPFDLTITSYNVPESSNWCSGATFTVHITE